MGRLNDLAIKRGYGSRAKLQAMDALEEDAVRIRQVARVAELEKELSRVWRELDAIYLLLAQQKLKDPGPE